MVPGAASHRSRFPAECDGNFPVSLCVVAAANREIEARCRRSSETAMAHPTCSLQDVPKPVPNEKEVLVRVRSAAINPFDWHFLRGMPLIARPAASGLLKPKHRILGSDAAGHVEAAGSGASRFRPGDEVFGLWRGRDGRAGGVRDGSRRPTRLEAARADLDRKSGASG